MGLMKKWMLLLAVLFSLALPAAAASPPVPRGPEYRINTSTASSHGGPSIAAFPDGGFVVVWSSSDGGIRARFLDAQGRPGREIRLAASGFYEQVIVDDDGNFLLVFATSTPSSPATGIFVRRFDRNGAPLGKRIRVSNLSRSERRNAVIAVGPEGRFAVAWEAEVRVPGSDATYSNAVGRIFAADGTPETSEMLLLKGDPPSAAGDDTIRVFPSSLAFKPDGTLVAVVQDRDTCAQIHLLQVPPGGPLSVQALGSIFCGSPSRDRSTSLVVQPDGSMIAAWSDFGEVQAQIFAPDGSPKGEFLRVSPKADIYQSAPVIAAQAGGRFVIAWAEQDLDENGLGVFGRSFSPNGSPRTGAYRINVTTEGEQSKPSIAAGRRAPIVAVWTQIFENRSDIFARRIAANP